MFVSPQYTQNVIVVSPTYYLVNSAFVDAGFNGKVHAVEELEDGSINLKEVERILQGSVTTDDVNFNDPEAVQARFPSITAKDPGLGKTHKKLYRNIMYCIPTFSNPRGNIIPEECRVKMLDLARKYDMLIVTDDVYDFLSYTTPVASLPERFVALDRKYLKSLPPAEREKAWGHSISNSSFSKVVAPGLRFGYMEFPHERLAIQAENWSGYQSGGSTVQFVAKIVGELLESGEVEKLLQRSISILTQKAALVRKQLAGIIDRGGNLSGGSGGYFMWLTLPPEMEMKRFIDRCKERDVLLSDGDWFEVLSLESENVRNWGKSSVRLSLAYPSIDEIQYGTSVMMQEFESLFN